ncbi:TLD-domain-containing protein [Cokeromyces recurvatus]|uniref:TLD-domain-containing protein n=1 Tax=Cokeromyces recurvatus TaxID=90255 RepID=UPI0022210C06|nr:TLD-domain-containing protein [Cokeromyces recurvatus]KAI7899659.1 TLD-domain-containing protein [Cokeromyces recurvatus]
MKKLFNFSSTSANYGMSKERLTPLYRSLTQDSQYTNDDSPITKLVCKLLGLPSPAVRPRLRHKSRSTTSITKSSVISSYQNTTLIDSNTSEEKAVRKPSAITIVTPSCTAASSIIMDWDQIEVSTTNKEKDDTSSISSSLSSTSYISTVNSSIYFIDSSNNKCISPAVDALVTASLIPTKYTKSILEYIPSIKLIHRKQDTEPVLTEAIAERIRPYIPKRYKIAEKWNLLYSLDQHGVSLTTLYSLMKKYDGPCVIILKDADEQIFGAYLSNTLSLQNYYYGTGECFLWKLNGETIKVFPWTGKNDYMILSDSDFIAIGGGDGTFGLWLNSELEKGYSNTCPTFDNEILSLRHEFRCLELEAWGLYI